MTLTRLLSFFLLLTPVGGFRAQTIYLNDFSDCSNIIFTNANDAGYEDYIDGINWECTTTGPSGPYPIAPIASTTADNGFVLVDSDLFGAEENYAATWVENCWFTIEEPVDLSAFPNISVEFETFYRCWDNTTDIERCFLEVSLDGVNWPDPTTLGENEGEVYVGGQLVTGRYEVFPTYERGDESDNPYLPRFDIGDLVGGESSVYFRWRWVGQWGYAWMVDDFRVFVTPQHDVKVLPEVSFTDYFNTGLWEAQTWPLGQLPSFNHSIPVTGLGTEGHPNTIVTLSVNGVDEATSAPQNVATGATVNFSITGWQPTSIGDYSLVYTASGDFTDEQPVDNTASRNLSVTQYQYGREDGVFEGQTPADGTVDFIAGVPFDAINDMSIYGIDVAIMSTSDVGAEVVCHLYDWNAWNAGGAQYSGLIATSAPLSVQADLLNDGTASPVWHQFAFESPYVVPAGSVVMAVFEHVGGDNVQIGTGTPQHPQTVFIYGPFGTGSAYDWYYTTNCPMIRLNLDPGVGCLGCATPGACNYDPEACGDNGSCVFPSGCEYCLGDDVANGDQDNDGVCDWDEVAGCMDPIAWNFDPFATDQFPGSCIYVPEGCASIGSTNWLNLDFGTYPQSLEVMFGTQVLEELIVNVPELLAEPQTGQLFGVQEVTMTSVSGVPAGLEVSIPDDVLFGGSQACATLVGIPSEVGLFQLEWTADVILSLFGSDFPIGNITFTNEVEVVPNPGPILGCMYSGALNFLSVATIDNGSCVIEGCMDAVAVNYHPIFNVDDGSCVYGSVTGPGVCVSDFDGDGLVGAADLVVFLGEFGLTCE